MSVSSNDSFDDDDNLLTEAEEEIDYYAILNVPRNATLDEINRAYKQRCLIFHPDRHVDEEDKRVAAKIFVQLRQAHETLSDSQLRSVYDTVGTRGLQIEGWQLVQRSTNPENIRKEYEFLKRLHENEIMLQRIHPTSTLVFETTLAGLFQENPDERYLPQVVGMRLSQGVECPLTFTDKIGLNGRVRVANGRGDCTLTASFRKILASLFHLDNSLTLSQEKVSLATKISRGVGHRAVFMVEPSVSYALYHEQFAGSLMLLYTMQLRPNWQGTLAFNCTPQANSLTTSIVKMELNQTKFLANLTLSPINSNIRIVYNHRYPELHDLHYETALTAGFFGFSPSLSVERRLSRFSKVGVSLHFSFPSCLLHAKFKLKTSLSNFEAQFTLCDNQDDIGRSTIYGVLLPLIVTHAARIFLKRPFARLLSLFEDQSVDEQVNECRKEEAQRIVHLMHDSAEKNRRDEERRHGLVIVKAHYGQLADDGRPGAESYPVAGECLVDVTIPVQTLVNDSQLRIFSTKDQLPGFYDPCPGQPKVLRVIYKFRDEFHSVTVNDDQALNIPLRAHLIQA